MDFKERLKVEQAELKEKILKLEVFLASDKVKDLTDEQEFMLRHQLLTMYPYMDILQMRMFHLKIEFKAY